MVNSMTALAVALVIASAVNLYVAHNASLAPYIPSCSGWLDCEQCALLVCSLRIQLKNFKLRNSTYTSVVLSAVAARPGTFLRLWLQ